MLSKIDKTLNAFDNRFINNFKEVDGFLTDIQIYILYLMFVDFCGTIVEIGSFKGKSSVIIGSAIRGNPARMFCVDHFNGSPEHKDSLGGQSTFEEFKNNIIKYGLTDYISVIKTDSIEASKCFEDNAVDCVFIDGLHTYEGVSEDILCWTPKLKSDGILFGHDYPVDGDNQFQELKLAVDKYVRDSNKFHSFYTFCGFWGAIKK